MPGRRRHGRGCGRDGRLPLQRELLSGGVVSAPGLVDMVEPFPEILAELLPLRQQVHHAGFILEFGRRHCIGRIKGMVERCGISNGKQLGGETLCMHFAVDLDHHACDEANANRLPAELNSLRAQCVLR